MRNLLFKTMVPAFTKTFVIVFILGMTLFLVGPSLDFSNDEAPKDNTKYDIAFISRTLSIDGSVYFTTLTGDKLKQFSDNKIGDNFVDWSPDGKSIVVARNFKIVIIDIKNKRAQVIVDNNTQSRYPRWSPDGKSIVFESQVDDNWEIFVVGINGRNLVRLTENDVFDGFPDWSPDSASIIFESNRDGTSKIYVMAADGTNPVRLTENDTLDESFPVWSPNGNFIAFEAKNEGEKHIYLYDIASGETRQVTHAGTNNTMPSWSPDATQIAYASPSEIDTGDFAIFGIAIDGTSEPYLIANTDVDDVFPAWHLSE